MTVINFLYKKHKVSKNVIDVLIEFYGKPAWLANPKTGQDAETILHEWTNELGDYCETDLKQACYRLFKYKKCSSFPSLSHVSSMLIDSTKELGKVSAVGGSVPRCIESELFERDCKLGKPFYTTSHYRKAVAHILDYLLPETIGMAAYRELELSSNDEALVRGRKYRKALDLGLFDDLDHLLWRSQNGGLYRC